MPLVSFDQLYQLADSLRQELPVAVAGGADRTVLESLRTACDRGWVRPLLVGTDAEIRHTAGACGVGLHGFTLVDTGDAGDACAGAVALVRRRQAHLLMKGQV